MTDPDDACTSHVHPSKSRAMPDHQAAAGPAAHPEMATGTKDGSAPAMRLNLTPAPGAPHATVVTVTGDVDLATASQLRDELLALLRRQPEVIAICLDQVSFLDSSGLGALLTVHRRAHLQGIDLRLVAPAHGPARVLHLSGMDRIFAIYAS